MSHSGFAFTGRLMSGKDTVIEKLGLKQVGLADPIHYVCEKIYGSRDKSIPGVRKAMQQVGRWGRGERDPSDNIKDCELITALIRKNGNKLFTKWKWVDWTAYGKDDQFWLRILTRRVAQVELPVVVNSLRFLNELEWIKRYGFEHYHIKCSEETWKERMAAKAEPFRPDEITDISEKLAEDLDRTQPPEKVIWNDRRPKNHPSCLTVEEFAAKVLA